MVQSKLFSSEDGKPGSDYSFVPPIVSASATDAEEPPLVVVEAVATSESQPLLYGSSSVTSEQTPDRVSSCSSYSGEASVPTIGTDQEEKDNARSVGAGVATGILGTLLLGPIFGVLLGFGAAYCTKKEGAMGDSARAIGDVALLTKEKAQDIDQKHNVVEKSKVVAGQAWEKAKDMDRKHNILVKPKDFAVFCFSSVKNFCVRNRVVERTADATGQAASWAVERMNKAGSGNNVSAGSNNAIAGV